VEYTIIFIKRGQKMLLLNRNKKPNMGLWNGVGGKIEQNETPSQSAIRETYEETGILLESIAYKGDVYWISEEGISGMHVFISEIADDSFFQDPVMTEEGILSWKDISWMLDPNNRGIVENIKSFLPVMLTDSTPSDHYYTYDQDRIVDYTWHHQKEKTSVV